MPELPEIYNLSRQMNDELTGKRIVHGEILQEKCLNVPAAVFKKLVEGKRIGGITSHGKWIFVKLEPDVSLLLNLGMGGNVILHKFGESPPKKYQICFDFDDGSKISIGFWWFGYVHAVPRAELKSHKMTASLGLDPFNDEFTYEVFNLLLDSKKGRIKSVLMDQKNIAGIGNVYIQDILFAAKLHPNRKTADISAEGRRMLFDAIRRNLRCAAELGGLEYEKDLYNQSGRFNTFLVGYKEGQPCPECGALIEKIKTGSTSTFICPSCQS